MPDLSALFAKALARRRPLLDRGHTQAWRALSGEFDGVPGVYADMLGPAAVLNVYEGRTPPGFDARRASRELLASLNSAGVEARAVYVKPFVRDRSRLGGDLPPGVTSHDPAAAGGAGTPVGEGDASAVTIREHSISLEIRLSDGLSTGLFLDQRENRAWVHDLARRGRARRVLNTFSYTCAFSVAAAAGGAEEVTSVDVSNKYLEWGKHNFTLSQLAPDKHRFAKMDSFEFLNYAKRKGFAYDLIILDPPSFGSGNKSKGIRPWSAVADYARLVREASALLAPRGTLLASTNNTELCAPGRLQRELIAGYGRKPRWVPLPPPGEDTRHEQGRVAHLAFEAV